MSVRLINQATRMKQIRNAAGARNNRGEGRTDIRTGFARLCWFLLVPVMMLSSCKTCWRGGEPLRASELRSLQRVVLELKKAEHPQLYRGLAHPKKDPRRYARQLQTQPHVMFRDFAFHQQPVPDSEALGRRLLRLYADPQSHQALAAPKTACAGFHPDYALVWQSGRTKCVLQVCYGCHEWKFFGPGGMMHTDINEPAYFDELMQWLPARP